MKYRIILLPSIDQSRKITAFAQSINVQGVGFQLDDLHIPHITVLAFEVEEAEANRYWDLLIEVVLLAAQAPVEGVDHFSTEQFKGYIFLNLLSSDSLRVVFSAVREALTGEIPAESFDKYSARPPHLTLGVDEADPLSISKFPLDTINFDRIALAQSSEYGSVAEVIHIQNLA